MKKILLITSLVALLIAPQTQAVTISSLSISPTTVSVTKGQTFTVSISLNPAGSPNYTTKVVLDYPASLVRLDSFVFAGGWMPLSQPEYDLIDNVGGKMIKTGGYPGGISSFGLFGTASFSSLGSGTGNISASLDSFSLDGSNQNTLSAALPSTILSINAAAPAPTPAPAPAEEPEEEIAPESEPAEEIEEIPIEETIPIPVTTPRPKGQATVIGSIGNILTIGTGNVWIGIFVGLVLLAVIAQIIRKAIKGTSAKKEKITLLPKEEPPKPKTKPRKPTPKKKK